MKKKKLISLDVKDIEKIEKIGELNNLNFSQTIKYLLQKYEDDLNTKILRDRENFSILSLYFLLTGDKKISESKLEKVMEFLYKNSKKIEEIKIKVLRKIYKKNNKKS